jgi:hypothetical protein
MGRTGRKREGRVVFLLTEGKEERDHVKSQDSYEKIQKKIASGNEFEFDLDNSPRILPREYQPDCVKKEIIPPNETTDALDLKVDRRKKAPKYQKDWSLPEDVETGFVRASMLGSRKRQNSENVDNFSRVSKPAKRKRENADNRRKSPAFVDPDSLMSPYMTKSDEEDALENRVHVSPTPKRLDILDTRNGSIPSGSVRNRLVRTRKTMNDPTRASRIYTEDDIEEFNSTPPNLIAVDKSSTHGLSKRGINAARRSDTIGSSPLKTKAPDNPFKNWEDVFSSGEELPDLSVELLLGDRKTLDRKRGKDSDDEYGLPSEFETTPRKRIRIELSSDDD